MVLSILVIVMLTGSLSMEEAFKDVDLVIEAVFERMDVKKEIFKKLDAIFMEGTTRCGYFTGMRWGQSERTFGVVIPAAASRRIRDGVSSMCTK